MVLELIQNVALLIAASVALQAFTRKLKHCPLARQTVAGLLFGIAALIGMMAPMHFAPGIIYDARSVALCLAGVFGGPVAAGIAAVLTGTYRIWLGGPGTIPGVITVLEAGALGVGWYYLRRHSEKWVGFLRLWLLGLAVHAAMLAAQLLLPGRQGWQVLPRVGPAVMVLYPLAVVLLAQVFLACEKRTRNEQALRNEREQLSFVIAGARLGTWVWNVQTDDVRINDTWARMLGYEPQELSEQGVATLETWERLVHPDDLPRASKLLESCVQGQADHYACEIRMHHKDGHWVWIMDRGRVMTRDPQGAPCEMFGTHTDISEAKRSEQQVRRSLERLQAIVEILQQRHQTLQGFLDYALEKALEITASKFGFIFFYDEDREQFVQNCWSKDVMKECRILDSRTCQELDSTGLWGEVVRQRRPILLNDFQAAHPLKKGYPAGHVQLTRFLSVPVFRNDRIVAVAGVANKDTDYLETDVLELMLLMDTVWGATDQKQSEETLRQNEKYLRTILQTTAEGFWMLNRQGRITDVNDTYCRMSGYVRDELLGMHIAEIDVDERPAETIERMNQITEQGSQLFVARHRRKDGECYPVEVSVSHLAETDSFVCFGRDLTERDRAEAALRQSEARLRRAQEVAHVGDWEFHFADGIVAASDEARRIYGLSDRTWSIEEVQRAPLPEYRVMLDKAMDDLVRHGTPYDVEFEIRRVDNGKVVVLHSVAEYDAQQNVVFGVIQDITDRRKAEEAQRELAAQLNQAQKMEAVGRLAGGVAHDFNNMLQTILGYTDMLLCDVAGDEPLQEQLEEIRKAGVRSADLTRQLLAFARKQTISPQVMNINNAITDLLNMLKRLIGENIELLWVPSASDCVVQMDPAQVNQVLANLVVNARDAIPGVGRITIETGRAKLDDEYCRSHAESRPGTFVTLAVSDNGEGMDAKTAEQAFEPFFTTKGKDHGTGLGLATVYGIVKQNDGFIDLSSEPGHGTTVCIYLPTSDQQPAERTTTQRADLPKGTETVLLVEDEPSLLKLNSRILEQLGYTVLPAVGPREALRIADEMSDQIDMLVTDVIMPNMSGRDLWDRLHRHYESLRCLFVSGYTANVIAHHGVLDPGVHFLQKPFSIAAMAHKLREILDAPPNDSARTRA